MPTAATLINSLGWLFLVSRFMRYLHLHATWKYAISFVKDTWHGQGLTDTTHSSKLQEIVDRQRIERAHFFCNLCYEKVDTICLFYLVFYTIRVYLNPEALHDIVPAQRFVLSLFNYFLLALLVTRKHMISKPLLMMAHSAALVAWLAIQYSTNQIDRAPQTVLRVSLGLIVSDFNFCMVSNLLYSLVLCGGLRWQVVSDQWFVIVNGEANILFWILIILWISHRAALLSGEQALQLKASVGAQWAMWSLLEARYDAVVQLGSDARIHRAFPRVKGLLSVHFPGWKTEEDDRRLPSLKDAPVYSFMPMPKSEHSKALEGCLFHDFMASSDDHARFNQFLRESKSMADDPKHLFRTEVIHVSLRDQKGNSIPVQLYHARFMDLFGEKSCHLIGICENHERAILENDDGNMSMANQHIGRSASESSHEESFAPLELSLSSHVHPYSLMFNVLDPNLSVEVASTEWIGLFGEAKRSLYEYFERKHVSDLHKWIQNVVNCSLSDRWNPTNAAHTYGKIKWRLPDASKLKAVITMTLLDPAHFFNEEQLSYIAVLSLAPVRKSSAGSRSSKEVRTLPSVTEENDDESSEIRKRNPVTNEGTRD